MAASNLSLAAPIPPMLAARPSASSASSQKSRRGESIRSHLTSLDTLSDDVIVNCLRERFMSDNIYTGIRTALVVVNPHKYAAEYRDITPGRVPLPPHIFQLANNAYYHMRRTGSNHAIQVRASCFHYINVLIHHNSGETASGKSENRRLAIKSLLELSVSNPGKKGSKLASQVPVAEFVVETYGNARTLFNPNASRFGKYTELQFTDCGRLCGIKTLDYYLEQRRVAAVPSGERNFHIFYYVHRPRKGGVYI